MTERQTNWIINLSEDTDMTPEQIASKVKVSVNEVNKTIHIWRHGKQDDIFDNSKLVDLYVNTNMPATEIAELGNYSVSGLYVMLRRNNVQFNRHENNCTVAMFEEQRTKDDTFRSMADKFGISSSAVYNVYKREGVNWVEGKS